MIQFDRTLQDVKIVRCCLVRLACFMILAIILVRIKDVTSFDNIVYIRGGGLELNKSY